jgi:hypothetical protein
MADYNGYIAKLKKVADQPDYDRLYHAIKTKAAPRALWPLAFSLVGAVTVCLVALTFAFYNAEPSANSETVASYLHEGTSINGNELIGYIFQE